MPSEFTVRSDSVDVEQIMGRIRARIREKRGVDYTEDEILALANVKIEGFLDPTCVRSDLLEHYLKGRKAAEPEPVPSRGLAGKLAGGMRLVQNPFRKLFRKLNSIRHALRELRLNFVLIHNLVVEITRLAIEVRNLKMRVESLSSRLDFNERRARAMEHVVQYRPGSGPGAGSSSGAEPARPTGAPDGPREPGQAEGQAKGEAQRRRRRRRRDRGGAGGAGPMSSERGGQAGREAARGSLPPEAGRDGGRVQNESALPFEPGVAPGATQPAPAAPAVPDRDTTGQ